ncbi:WhiB family transcriptional regulator [Streptomyces sp. NPDC050803]|uniref:WhiB family transcriptional regulator n=1 Tax=unclassified Streptomyces TaxID=2593676 RepID=UPI003448BF03
MRNSVSNWRDRARCRGADPELFFPLSGTGPSRRQIEEAKAVCHRCPVRGRCLAWALEAGEESGVWGGTDEDERRRMRRQERRGRGAARS